MRDGALRVNALTVVVFAAAASARAAQGYTNDQVALLLFLMQFGMIGVQLPLGALSDRIDRRYVLLIAAAIVAVAAMAATRLDVPAAVWVILVFAIWAGATESIFAAANAHAHDRAAPQFYVTLSSTLIVCRSISGVIMPAVATALTEVAGPRAFIYVAFAIAVAFGLSVAWRVSRRTPVPEDEQAPYQPISAQLPYTAELAPLVEEEKSTPAATSRRRARTRTAPRRRWPWQDRRFHRPTCDVSSIVQTWEISLRTPEYALIQIKRAAGRRRSLFPLRRFRSCARLAIAWPGPNPHSPSASRRSTCSSTGRAATSCMPRPRRSWRSARRSCASR